MLFNKSKTSAPKKELKLIQLFTFAEVPVARIPAGALLWGDPGWWPSAGPFKFSKITNGDEGLGTQYDFQLAGFLAPAGISEVTQYEPRQVIERTFRRGFFVGYEVVQISERANGTRIDYEMHYQVTGVVQRLLWDVFYKKKFILAVEAVLEALKQDVVKPHDKDQA